MAEYTPTTDALRDLWVDHLLDPLPRHEGIALVPLVQAAFDQWLAERDREVAARAWDKGYAFACNNGLLLADDYDPNPYREEN